MIKRPIIILFFAFLIGTLSYFLNLEWFVWCMFVLLCLFDIISLKQKLYNKFLRPEDRILLLLPILFLIGYSRMKDVNFTYPVNEVFESQLECKVSGRVVSVDTSGVYLRFTLEQVQISELSLDGYKEESDKYRQESDKYKQESDESWKKLDEPKGDCYECSKIIVSLYEDVDLQIGNLVLCTGTLQRFEEPGNPGQFNEENYYKGQGYDYKFKAESLMLTGNQISFFWDQTAKLKQKILSVYDQVLDDKDYGIVAAMLLGETAYMEEDLQKLYQTNGISHLISISGLHITLIGLGLFHLLRKLKLGVVMGTVISIGFIIYYGVLTGFSVSTNRAVVMMVISLFGGILGRTYDMKCSLVISAFIILLQNPMQMFRAGFLLSYGAVLGIVFVNQIIKEALQIENRWVKTLLLTVSIQVTTLPLILYQFFEFPLYSVIVNLIVVPMSSVLVSLALFSGIFGCLSIALAGFMIGGAHYILLSIQITCNIFSKLYGCTQTWGKPNLVVILMYYAVLILILGLIYYLSKVRDRLYQPEGSNEERTDVELLNGIMVQDMSKENVSLDEKMKDSELYLPNNKKIAEFILVQCRNKKVYYICCILIICFQFLFLSPNKKGLVITMLDVGQGDGIYVESESGNNYLIDCGSSYTSKLATYRVIPFLKSIGRTSIDTIIITHPDHDHTSGILELITNGYPIHKIILPDIEVEEEAYDELVDVAKEAGISIDYIKRGDWLEDGKLIMRCLHPYETFVPTSTNSYSTVLSLEFGEFNMLLTGDVEDEGEEALCEVLKDSKVQEEYDVLKVAHHGSKYSTSEEFIELVKPKYSFISVGANNRYGHPDEELVERLEKTGSTVHSTKDCGAITIKTNGKEFIIECFKK